MCDLTSHERLLIAICQTRLLVGCGPYGLWLCVWLSLNILDFNDSRGGLLTTVQTADVGLTIPMTVPSRRNFCPPQLAPTHYLLKHDVFSSKGEGKISKANDFIRFANHSNPT
eukprot:3891150-Pleurochrysis_carterae.AAC.6